MPIVVNPFYRELNCPVCGAGALEDEGATDSFYYNVPYDEMDEISCYTSTFHLTCQQCRAVFSVDRVARYYWQPLLPVETVRMTYEGEGMAQITLRISDRALAHLPPDVAQRLEAYKRCIQSQDFAAAIRLVAQATYPAELLRYWLRAALSQKWVALSLALVEHPAIPADQYPAIFHQALCFGMPDVALALVNKGVKLSAYYSPGETMQVPGLPPDSVLHKLNTPLSWAVMHGHQALVDRLLEVLPDPGYHSMMLYSLLSGQRHFAQQALARGANATSVIHFMIRHHREEDIRWLLEQGVSLFGAVPRVIKLPDGSSTQVSETNLHFAVLQGLDWIVTLWLAEQPDIRNVLDNKLCTPLHYAVEARRVEMARLLIAHHVPLDVCRLTDGCSALHLALLGFHTRWLAGEPTEDDLSLIRLLVEAGARTNQPLPNTQQTPRQFAESLNAPPLLAILP